MSLSKIAAGIAVFALAATVVRAADIVDNPEQAAARAALVSKLFDMSAASAETNNYQPTPKKTAPAVAAPIVTAPVIAAPTVAAPVFSTTTVVKPALKVDDTVMHPVSKVEPVVYTPAPRMDHNGNFHVFRSPRMDIQNPPMNWTRAEAPRVSAPAVKFAPVVKTSPPVQTIVKPVAPKIVAAPKAMAASPAMDSDHGAARLMETTPRNSAAQTRKVSNPPVTKTTGTTVKPMPTLVVKTEKPMPTAVVKTAKPMPAPAVKPVNSDFAPLVAPPSPLAANKQQQLLDLLNKYKADQITPEQYHLERSRIISGF